MNTAEQSCGAFLDALASKAPVPGGGGASALAGALGAALCTMVGNYTVGKQKYAAVEEDVKALMARAEDLRARLLVKTRMSYQMLYIIFASGKTCTHRPSHHGSQ